MGHLLGYARGLEDESGVILGRAKIPKGKFISDLDCQVHLVFERADRGHLDDVDFVRDIEDDPTEES